MNMTRMLMDVNSDCLELHTQVNLLIPDCRPPSDGFPVLYLLHGKGGDHTDWTRLCPIEHYVRETGPLCVVMPEVQHSFYRNMKYGLPYYDYISGELPEKLNRLLPLTESRDETFVCGGSMGGYGAMLLALHQPERFGRAASISGALDVWEMIQTGEWKEWQWIFGEASQFPGSSGDLLHVLGQVKGEKPRLFACCGLEDGLTGQNRAFTQRAKQLGYDMTFIDGHGGHDWNYRNLMIQKVLDWLTL